MVPALALCGGGWGGRRRPRDARWSPLPAQQHSNTPCTEGSRMCDSAEAGRLPLQVLRDIEAGASLDVQMMAGATAVYVATLGYSAWPR